MLMPLYGRNDAGRHWDGHWCTQMCAWWSLEMKFYLVAQIKKLAATKSEAKLHFSASFG